MVGRFGIAKDHCPIGYCTRVRECLLASFRVRKASYEPANQTREPAQKCAPQQIKASDRDRPAGDRGLVGEVVGCIGDEAEQGTAGDGARPGVAQAGSDAEQCEPKEVDQIEGYARPDHRVRREDWG